MQHYRFHNRFNANRTVMISSSPVLCTQTFELSIQVILPERTDLDAGQLFENFLIPLHLCNLHELSWLSKTDGSTDVSLEALANGLFGQLQAMYAEHGCRLCRLDLYETPTKVVSVSENLWLGQSGLPTDTVQYDRYLEANRTLSTQIQLEPPTSSRSTKTAVKSSVTEPAPTKIQNRQHAWLCFFGGILFLLLCANALVFALAHSGFYPQGEAIYGHLFQANCLTESIQQGIFFPSYSSLWYNGIQPLQGQSPLSYYLLALFAWLADSAKGGYLLFTGFALTTGGVGWLLFGFRRNRWGLCIAWSILWFFLPEALRVFFAAGELPRMAAAILLPWLLFFAQSVCQHPRKRAWFGLFAVMLLLSFTHFASACAAWTALFFFFVVHGIHNKRLRQVLFPLCSTLLALGMGSLWILPSLKGQVWEWLTAEHTSTVSTAWWQALNPLNRFGENPTAVYIGLSLVCLALLGAFFGGRDGRPAFLTAILCFLLGILPFNFGLNTALFLPLAAAFCLLGILQWNNLRKSISILFCVALLLDALPSLIYIVQPANNTVTQATQPEIIESELLDSAKELTNQRLLLLDSGEFGSFPAYYCTTKEPSTNCAFGYALSQAATKENLVLLETALEKECYDYVFDRAIECGCDTILLSTRHIINRDMLCTAAERSGYDLLETSDQAMLFHRDTPSCFGVQSSYSMLAIGSSSREITLAYPAFEQGASNELSDYSYDTLKTYQALYLSGFTYQNQQEAEALLTKLSEQGTRIYIDMEHAPSNLLTGQASFLGVTAQTITLQSAFPPLTYQGVQMQLEPFTASDGIWNTVYLNGLSQTWAEASYHGETLPVIGTGKNENLLFLGFNLLHHQVESGDPVTAALLQEVLGVSAQELPARTLIPLSITQTASKLSVTSSADNVNTTLALLNNFQSDSPLYNYNHFLLVNRGTTEITWKQAHRWTGPLLSACILAAELILTAWWCRSRSKERKLMQ